MEEMKLTKEDAVADLPELAQNEPIGPMVGISAMALNMALKFHDINTIQDGQLYQQYKLEGKNMRGLHLDMVFETAIRMETHLVAANKRVAKMIVAAALAEDIEAEPEGAVDEDVANTGGDAASE